MVYATCPYCKSTKVHQTPNEYWCQNCFTRFQTQAEFDNTGGKTEEYITTFEKKKTNITEKFKFKKGDYIHLETYYGTIIINKLIDIKGNWLVLKTISDTHDYTESKPFKIKGLKGKFYKNTDNHTFIIRHKQQDNTIEGLKYKILTKDQQNQLLAELI